MLSTKSMLMYWGISCLAILAPLAQRAKGGDYEEWIQTQREILVQGSWEAALTDADGSKGAVTMVFYPNGQLRLSAWVLDPTSGKYLSVPAASFTGFWAIKPNGYYSGQITFTPQDGGGADANYLELLTTQKMGLTKLPRDGNERILFINRR